MKRPLGRFHIHSPFQKACQQPRAESACYHFFPISEYSYKLIRFLLHRSIVKSNNEIGKFFLLRYGMSQMDSTIQKETDTETENSKEMSNKVSTQCSTEVFGCFETYPTKF